MDRTPPSVSRFSFNAVPIYAFTRNQGSVSNTFIGRIIRRVPYRVTLRDGEAVDAVRYAGRYWPIYQGETFTEISRKWVGKNDTLLGDNGTPLKLPIKHPYLFECDTPRGYYT